MRNPDCCRAMDATGGHGRCRSRGLDRIVSAQGHVDIHCFGGTWGQFGDDRPRGVVRRCAAFRQKANRCGPLNGRVEAHESGRYGFHDPANVNYTIGCCSPSEPSAESGSETEPRSLEHFARRNGHSDALFVARKVSRVANLHRTRSDPHEGQRVAFPTAAIPDEE